MRVKEDLYNKMQNKRYRACAEERVQPRLPVSEHQAGALGALCSPLADGAPQRPGVYDQRDTAPRDTMIGYSLK